MDFSKVEDILNKAKSNAGWPSNHSPDEEFDLEYGTETTPPKPALRLARPAIEAEAANSIDALVRKYLL